MRNYLLFISFFALTAGVIQPSSGSQPFSPAGKELIGGRMPALPAAALPAAALPSDDHGGQIVSKYDGFNHETVVTLKKMKVTCSSKHGILKDVCISIMASLHCPGIQLDYVRQVTMQVVFETRDWDQRHPLDQRDFSVVADGDTIRLGRMELAGTSVDTLMTETLQTKIPYAVFKKMALAEVVELQVGKSTFELREKNLLALRDLNNRVKFAKRA
jgi:hypothetical protein